MYNHHSDEYKMRAVDLKDVEMGYNLKTEEGKKRSESYEALRKKTFKMFETKQNEVILDNANSGHIY